MPPASDASGFAFHSVQKKRGAGLLIVLIFSILYFLDVALRASEKFFWYDELFTVYFARLPDLHALWTALGSGIDFNPPPFYLLTRACNLVFGEGPVTTRLPQLLGFWILSVCLFRFASRRGGLVPGTIAMLFPMLTGAYYYAYEARPHGVVLGFCGLALVCWQKAGEPEGKRGALVGLAAALLGAFMMHCFAILLVAPFACVELLQVARYRRIDWPRWLALLIPSMIAVAVYVPLLRSFRKLAGSSSFAQVAVAGWSQVGHFYESLFAPCMVVVLAALVLFAVGYKRSDSSRPFATSDGLLGLAFLLLPAFGVVLGKVIHGPYFHRYFFSAVAGVAITMAAGAALRGERSRVTWALAAMLAFGVLLNFSRLSIARLRGKGEPLVEPSSRFLLNTTPGAPLAMHPLLESERSALPIAVINPFEYLYLAHYAHALRERLYFMSVSPEDFTYAAFGRFFRCCVTSFNQPVLASEFVRTHAQYLVYGDGETVDQVAALAMPGSCVESARFKDRHFLVRMSRR